MSEASGYVLRIASKQWVTQVFNMAIYYTNMHRKWKTGQTVIFIHRTDLGDAVVGYGIVESVYKRDELSESDKRECEKGGWKQAIEFKYVKQFDRPLSVRKTFLKDSKLRGKYLHGLELDRKQVETIITEAET
jgi:hypothetical protein